MQTETNSEYRPDFTPYRVDNLQHLGGKKFGSVSSNNYYPSSRNNTHKLYDASEITDISGISSSQATTKSPFSMLQAGRNDTQE